MPVNDRLMAIGTWSLQLDPQTPKSVRDLLVAFGCVFIMDAPVDVRLIADADVKANARYAGILRRRATAFDLEGPGLLAYLGDEEGKGHIYSYAPGGAFTFLQWMTYVITTLPGGVGSIRAGNLSAVGAGTYPNTGFPWVNVSQRYVLDFMAQYFTGLGGSPAEYRVNPDGTIDAGPSASLFVTTPTAIVVPREGGRDNNILGIEPSRLDLEFDGDDYSTDVKLVGATGTGTAFASSVPYNDLYGATLRLTRVVNNSQVAAGAENAMATAQENLYSALRQQVTLASDRYDIPRDVAPGDWIYVFDPDNDLVDTSVNVNYRGQILNPQTIRVFAINWPIERGMGVYYRDLNGVYTDLTPWVLWEQPGTTFEVGTTRRRLVDAGKDLLGR